MALQFNMNFFDRTISSGGITSVWWVQLSTAIIFGLAFSTVLTLVMIPSMLALPANIAAPFTWIAGKLRKSKQADLPVTQPYVKLDDLNQMMKTARAAKPKKQVAAAKRHPEDSSVVPMPKSVKKKPPKKSLPAAAE